MYYDADPFLSARKNQYDNDDQDILTELEGAVNGENTFDFDFSGSNESDPDEDYSEKEDLIVNKKFYAKDMHKPFEKNIPKTEIEYLLKDQEPIINQSRNPSPIGVLHEDSKFPLGFLNDQQSSLMCIPLGHKQSKGENHTPRSKKKPTILGKRNLPDISYQGRLHLDGYAEYLQQSQNLQNSLFNNCQAYDFDNSIEPIITRKRRQQLQFNAKR